MSADAIVAALSRIAPKHVRVAARSITAGDEEALTREERALVPTSGRRASGAARIAARALIDELHVHPTSILRSSTGAPRWPAGIVGSLAHDEHVALAVVARSVECSGLGVDVEPRAPLPRDLLPIVLTPRERRWAGADLVLARLVFCAKEAVFKALHPLDGRWLDLHDVEVDERFRATVRAERSVDVVAVDAGRLAALVVLPASYRSDVCSAPSCA